ncbi:MAG TPA: metallophosphoesterase [Myxococcales bacterium]|nr:metallophosphoesterase [Myxococcales bacterium]
MRHGLDRRDFLRLAAGAALGAPFGLLDIATAAEGAPFRLAYLSDTHLCEADVDDRPLRAALKAIADINALDPRPDLVLFAGDLTEHGSPAELELGRRVLAKLRAPVKLVAGEHDWYLDLGAAWQRLFGPPSHSFDHRGIHFVGLHSVGEADFWTGRGLLAAERQREAASLDGSLRGPFEVGDAQRRWLAADLARVAPSTPVVLFTHVPLFRYAPAWHFSAADGADALALLRPFRRATVLHGHTHQLLCHRDGRIDFHGLLSTAWPLPYPPGGLPALAVQMTRPDPFDPFDGCGDGQLVIRDGAVDAVHNLWARDAITVTARYLDSDGRIDRPPAPPWPSY